MNLIKNELINKTKVISKKNKKLSPILPLMILTKE